MRSKFFIAASLAARHADVLNAGSGFIAESTHTASSNFSMITELAGHNCDHRIVVKLQNTMCSLCIGMAVFNLIVHEAKFAQRAPVGTEQGKMTCKTLTALPAAPCLFFIAFCQVWHALLDVHKGSGDWSAVQTLLTRGE